MKVKVYSKEGKELEEISLNEKIFNVELNSQLIYDVVNSELAEKRQNTAKVKKRGEVRGGGRKPWRQKGTGRARVGSIRSPLWPGGGKIFGPDTERVYSKKINKKAKRKALFMALSEKARGNNLILLDELKVSSPKTREMNSILKNQKLDNESVLIASSLYDADLIRASRNLKGKELVEARNLNPLSVLKYKYLLMPKSSLEVIEKTFLK